MLLLPGAQRLLPSTDQEFRDAILCSLHIEGGGPIKMKHGHAVQHRPQILEQESDPGTRTTRSG